MKKRAILGLCLVLVISLLLPMVAFAHSGRTDSSGGHKDNKNKSGLGSYHYHCGGHPAHLHENGVCPYAPKDKIDVKNMPSKMYAGDSLALDWTVTSYSGSGYVRWDSSDTSVVSVSSDGRLQAVGAGKATITAEMDNGSKSFTVKVEARLVSELRMAEETVKMAVGEVHELSCEVLPENADNRALAWRSDDENVVIAAEGGIIIAVGEGSARIVAAALDGSGKTASARVEVTPSITGEVESLPAGFVLKAKPGSAAAKFALNHGIEMEYALPEGFPLKRGSRGEAVKDVQAALIQLAYLQDKADGSFGKKTEAAVNAYLAAAGKAETGSIGQEDYIQLLEAASAN